MRLIAFDEELMVTDIGLNRMRLFLVAGVLLLAGCNPGLQFNSSPEMTPQTMLERASLVFVGVIEGHHFDSWPFFRLAGPGIDRETARFWKVLRRTVRVELVLRGRCDRDRLDIFEITWTGGTTGNWNSTFDRERALFLVRRENGRYHVVRDWWRSIFPVTTGRHSRLPLTDSHPLWERIALMNYWLEQLDHDVRVLDFNHNDPGGALTQWRRIKLLRGMVRHPRAIVRVSACRDLLLYGGWLQDECRDELSPADRTQLSELSKRGYYIFPREELDALRRDRVERGASYGWRTHTNKESRRLLTAINSKVLRKHYCKLWEGTYPDDHDAACPADKQPPATVVTVEGDIPLLNGWPASH